MAGQRGPAAAPYFSLADATWIPYAFAWDDRTDECRGVEGPRGFASYQAPAVRSHRSSAPCSQPPVFP
jgi:hypothetical protein